MSAINPGDDFDRLVSKAMQAWPSPAPMPGLASAARSRATAMQRMRSQSANAMLRHRRQGALVNLLTGAVLALFLGILLTHALPLNQPDPVDVAVEETATDLSTDGIWNSSSEDIVIIAGAALVGVGILLCVERALSTERSTLPTFLHLSGRCAIPLPQGR
jgi:hypothetical protein